MRINTVNEKYLMIKSEEISNFVLEKKDESEEKFNVIMKIYNVLKDYYFENHSVPREIAISMDFEMSKLLLENIDNRISITDIHNSFMYAVMTNNIKNFNILKELLNQHETVTYDYITNEYGKELSYYIIENKDYDYIDNVNRVNRKDSSILLFDGEKLEFINLVDSELVLQNVN